MAKVEVQKKAIKKKKMANAKSNNKGESKANIEQHLWTGFRALNFKKDSIKKIRLWKWLKKKKRKK